MAASSKYTDEQRQIALDIYEHQGPRAAARATGVSSSTITRWAQQAGIAGRTTEKTREATEGCKRAWAEWRVQLLADLGPAVNDALGQIGRCATSDGQNARYWAITFGTLLDKAQLLSGGATERVDFGSLPADERLARLAQARDGLADELSQAREKRAVGQ